MIEKIRIVRPDDWHLHVRDGAMLKATLPYTAAVFGRAIIMPNLRPPIRTLNELRAYRHRICSMLPTDSRFQPLMTLYLTDNTDPREIFEGADSGELSAVKLYPSGATTNSEDGVRSIASIAKVLDAMQRVDIPLLLHGEVTDPTIDIFDREAVFIDRVLEPLRRDFPALRIVLEHITTHQGATYVEANSRQLAATITPHHLMINRTHIFQGGIRPHLYCLPIAKREEHRLALRRAAISGKSCFFLGTDSAPHPSLQKESECGCAGVFNAPVALSCIAQVFEEESALEKMEAFVSRNGPLFYRLAVNSDTITLERRPLPENSFPDVETEDKERVRIFRPPTGLHWSVTDY